MITDFAGRSQNSKSKEWCTPPKYADAVHEFFDYGLDLDPCSNAYSIIKARRKICLPNDGLNHPWGYSDTIFVNPPYGKDKERKTSIKDWLHKCAETNERYGAEILALVPVATNTKHWKDHIFEKASAICFLADTRLKFLENGSLQNKGVPMAHAMVYWGNDIEKFREIFKKFGTVVFLKNFYLVHEN